MDDVQVQVNMTVRGRVLQHAAKERPWSALGPAGAHGTADLASSATVPLARTAG